MNQWVWVLDKAIHMMQPSNEIYKCTRDNNYPETHDMRKQYNPQPLVLLVVVHLQPRYTYVGLDVLHCCASIYSCAVQRVSVLRGM